MAYSGIQQRARDAKRTDDVSKIVQAVRMWYIDNQKGFDQFGGGNAGTATGWFDEAYSPYPSVKSILVGGKYLSDGTTDPINYKVTPVYAYMISTCNDGDKTRRVVLARLETPPTETLSQQLGGYTCSSAVFADYTVNYGMNYVRMVNVY